MASRSFISFLLTTTIALAGVASGAPTAPAVRNTPGTFLGVPVSNADFATEENTIPSSYIVVYDTDADDEVVTSHQSAITQVVKKRNLNKRDFNGNLLSTKVRTGNFMGLRTMSLQADDLMIMEIMNDTTVKYVEADTYVKATALVAQSDAPLGLRRLSAASADDLNLSNQGTVTDNTPAYTFEDTGGEGITAYVVDTGIRITHSEFQDRATFGFNAITDEVGGDADDDNGHGSHVSGTIGGRTFGVAKAVSLVAVKVLDADGGGANSDVLQGMNFVMEDVADKGINGTVVMNMSLGGSRSNAINNAIERMTEFGIVPVVAAGNEAQDTANTSPGSATNAITVGAIDASSDILADFSNFGEGVDIHGPGVDVLSVGIASDNAMETLSGTSMASPHVCGLAAYLMSTEGISANDEKLQEAVVARIKELAGTTGAAASGVPNDGTTTLIAFNGNTA
ncbi:subtilase [Zalerion maritima]|uniref:Subtilase n=1 Tax=Zalerion maritima TaxID=339359 RepID=A0AAD5WPV9_9PEZI|nr:subtilase [Zalerion maritima]